MSIAMRITAISSFVLLFLTSCATQPRPSYQPGATTQLEAGQAAEDSNVEHVRNVVNLRQVQLQNLYKKQTNVQAMQGELNIKLYITEEGIIQQAEINQDTGNLSQDFIDKVKQEVLTWRFIVRKKVIYSFKVQFRKM